MEMAASAAWPSSALKPFGLEIDRDLSRPISDAEAGELRALYSAHKLLVFRKQALSEERQVHVMSLLGRVLGSKGEYRELSSDGNLGAAPLCYHSDLAFTEEPFKALSLHALAVNDGQSWTAFANGVTVVDKLPAALRQKIEGRDALTVISVTQTHRDVEFDPPAFLPQQTRLVLTPHPQTGEPILYISEMQTARIEGYPQKDSDALLSELFAALYDESNVYRHYWNNGDFVIWDNLALSHARCDLANMHPRRLQRVAIADKSFFDLCPQFDLGDSRISAWAFGQKLTVD
jgi:taurine dioxygenase